MKNQLLTSRLVDVASAVPRKPVVTQSTAEEKAFLDRVRTGVIGTGAPLETPYGVKPLRYFDFIASGRCHRDIEDELAERVLPYMANTHTSSSATGKWMTECYEDSFRRIAGYINASKEDVLIPVGNGSTGAINRMITVLGLRIPDQL